MTRISRCTRFRLTRTPRAEDAGDALGEGFLPSLYLARVDFVPGAQLGHHLLALHRLQRCLGLESRGCASFVLSDIFPLLPGQLPLPLV